MKREIRITAEVMARVVGDKHAGRFVTIPVRVDWPELRLTEDQLLANARASAYGYPRPHLDLQVISVVLERP